MSPLARVARFCVDHRRLVLIGWVVVVIAALAISSAVGTRYATNFSLPGTESQRTTDLLKRDFPAQAGDTDQIVFAAKQGKVTDPAVRARIAPMLAKVERLPHVTGVVGPYGPAGARAISKDGRIAFATINFDKRANDLPKDNTKKVISVARAAGSSAAARPSSRHGSPRSALPPGSASWPRSSCCSLPSARSWPWACRS